MSRLIDADALWMDIIRSIDYCEDILKFIDNAPTVNQWIPCSERLPEEDGWYLCSYESRLVQSTVFYNGGWFNVNVDVNNVLAWMPLPEPYKEDNT